MWFDLLFPLSLARRSHDRDSRISKRLQESTDVVVPAEARRRSELTRRAEFLPQCGLAAQQIELFG